MVYVWVCAAAAATAILTLFSGFGLGTLLLPVFALFFPLALAVAAVAVVHLANNVFKVALLGRYAHAAVVLRFGLPAAAMSFVGALLLTRLASVAALGSWSLGGHAFVVTPVGLVLGALIAVFAVLELSPALERLQFGRRWLWLGGAISGFCGGLSGHQGALRAAFLVRSGLDRDAFLGTSVVCAVMVDVVRVLVYGQSFYAGHWSQVATGNGGQLMLAATLSAFAGSYAGTRLVRKVTLPMLQRCVGVGLVLLAVAIALGLV
jgi:uncharacterized membrane protein YfcA